MHRYQNELVNIKEILKDNTHGMTVSEIAEKLNINRNSVAKYLDVLTISGEVKIRNLGPAKMFYISKGIPISSLMECSKDIIVVVDRNYNYLFANKAFLKKHQLTADQVIGKNAKNVLGSKVFERIEPHLIKCLNGESVTYDLNIKYPEKENCKVRVSYHPLKNEKEIIGVIGIVSDCDD